MCFKIFEAVICIIISIALKIECIPNIYINDSVVIENKNINITCYSQNVSTYSTWVLGKNNDFQVANNDTTGKCYTTSSDETVVRCYRPDNKTFIVTVRPNRMQHSENLTCNIKGISSNTLTLDILVPVTKVTLGSSAQSTIVLKENVTKEVTCKTSYSRPKASIKCYINSTTESTDIDIKDDLCSKITNNLTLVSTQCTLPLTLSRKYNKWYIVCSAENIKNYNPVVTGNITLNILHQTNQPSIQCTNNGIYKVVQNTNGTLTCSVDGGNPAGTLHWNCTGDLTDYQGPYNNVTQTVVWSATQTQYCTCTANNSAGPRSISVKTEVLYQPVIDELHNTTVFEGDSIILQCVVLRSNPAASVIQWTSNKHNISRANLSISNVSRAEGGMYTCTANNTMDPSCKDVVNASTSRSLHMEILYPPSVTIPHVKSFEVVEGSEFSHTCPITPGHPSYTTFIWKRSNDTKFLISSKEIKLDVKQYDDSVYTCYASNRMINSSNITRMGNVSVEIRLVVLFRTNVTEFYIRGFRQNIKVVVQENTSLVFECHLQSNPKSDVRVYEDEALVNSSRANDLLYYKRATCSGGPVTYSCHGNNSLSNTSSERHVQLFVNCTPRRAMHVDELIATSVINATVTLSYTTLAYPLPSFTWYRNGTITNTTDPRITISSSNFQTNLIINRLVESDFGHYILTVVNDVGSINESFHLKPQEKDSVIPNTESSAALIRVIGGTVAGIVLIGVVIVGVVVLKRRVKKKPTGNPLSTPEMSASMYENVKNVNKPLVKPELSPLVAISDRGIYENAEIGESKAQMPIGETSIQTGKYENFSKKDSNKKQTAKHKEVSMGASLPDRTATKHRTTESEAPPPIPAKTDYAGLLCKVDDDDGHVNNNVNDENVYNNTTEKIERIENVLVHELFDFVAGKSFESFATEFNVLPKGLTMPYTVAVKPENIKLNRYNGIFPYDHSRVTIQDDPDFFTNACYMNGFKKEKCYIASLGPTADTSSNFKTFWRMVWHEQSDIIVMVTNLREITGMKCEQYWPKFETSIIYGEITVTIINVEEYAEYTVRTFKVSHDGNCRTVTQLHFTAWPDKGVPDDLTSLLEFRQRIISTSSIKLGPVIVHCSAGIGRTGTLIALDRLILEGKATHSINVSSCVRSMRQQRVSMVQTQEQYMYIYKACVYALACECDSILAEKFHEKFKSTTDAQFADLFKKLKTIVDNESEDEKKAILNNKMDNSNRTNADIEGDRHRVRLYVDKESEDSDYTNAVYINSFKTKNKFIAAQTPLKDFVQDFVCTVFQEQCVCVVDMDGNTPSKGDVGIYIPSGKQTVKFGNFTISCDQLESNPKYTVNKMTIENTGKFYKGEWTCYHFKYHDWKHGKDTPGNTNDFVDLWKEVNEYANQFGEKESHILIHCLDGSNRSGLFCFVACLLEKIQWERQVNIGNTLRQVRTRRKTTVRNANQLKFCFKTVDAFIETKKAK